MTSATERDFKFFDDIPTLKDRNRVVRELEADGWTVKPGGGKSYGYNVQAHKGEAPVALRRTFGIGTGQNDLTPLYKRAGGAGFEYLDGTPEHP